MYSLFLMSVLTEFAQEVSVLMSSRVSLYFSIRLSVSGLMLKSLINLGLSFMQDSKYGSIYLFLHVDILFAQFVEDDFIFPVYISDIFIKIWCPYVSRFISQYSISLTNISVFLPIPCVSSYYSPVIQPDIRNDKTCAHILFKIVSANLGLCFFI